MAEARRLAHNLKGTSRSCGFDKLGALAELLEYSLRDILEQNVDEWEKVEKALAEAKKESEKVRVQFMDYVPTAEELQNLNNSSAKARVLMVCAEPQQKLINGNGGIPLELINVTHTCDVMAKAIEKQLDAALIEILPGERDQAFQMARELRSLPGYDNLPLGFIYDHVHDAERSDATHAGASIFIEKPFARETLNEALQHLITIREGGRSRVLIVDDDEDFTELISVALGNEGMLVRALHDPFKVSDVLEEYSPDLMLLDVMMPGILGFDVCRKVRGSGRWQDLPIIFLTAQTDLNSRLSAFDAGGDDYLIKPVINAELLKRVKVRLDKARMQRERQDRDVLTGLLLRRAFSDSLSALLSESERHGFNFSLSLLDIDHFKKVNDNYGHMAGDRVLAHVGKLLRKRFRVEDLRGRWGGEEFILAFRHEKKETMKKALNRVLEELCKIEFKGDSGESFYTSFSAGMVDFPADGTNAHDLILSADRRLYVAKKNGRNQICIEG
jgi:diguanylate cyclase (GGDEF)-like protein